MYKLKVQVLTSDQNFVDVLSKSISKQYQIIPRIVDEMESIKNIRAILKDETTEILGVDSGSIEVCYVVIDSEFQAKNGEIYFIDDPLFEDLPEGANTVLAMLLGGGISVIVKPKSLSFLKGWSLGKRGALLLEEDSLINEKLAEAKENVSFSQHTLEVENDFALVYDEEELSGAATVSAILWENEFTLLQVTDFIKHSTSKVKILDLGCGTGRFEEIILKNDLLSSKVETIYAVDFAPQYLVEAKHRLGNLLDDKNFNKIKFLRRVAESLQWPENYFDIVIAGFGVVCFSKSHLTLQQVYKVLKPKGLALINGYNRDAATYEFDNAMKIETGAPASHFAIRIDREENVMHLGNDTISCFTFDSHGLDTLLKQIGFKPKKNSSHTFPTLYGTSRRDYLRELAKTIAKNKPSKKEKDSQSVASYESKNLISDKYQSGFNEILHLMDRDLALVMPNKGFYFCTAANK